MILGEYALVPDIFDPASYSAGALAPVCLGLLKEPLLSEALVRDLRDGEWSRFMSARREQWHRVGIELFTKLWKQGRLVRRPAAGPQPCESGKAWIEEALASHAIDPLRGIIATEPLATEFRTAGPVASVEKLMSAAWWRSRPSFETARTIDAYRDMLRPVLTWSRSIMFVDRFIDPSARGYAQFHELILMARGRVPAPRIELHRVCYLGAGAQRQLQTTEAWERAFRTSLGPALADAGLSVEVFIWDDFHDRYLISDLTGITLSNSFDTSNDPRASVTWSRLDRDLRDAKQREFDSGSHHHKLHHRFRVP